MAVTDILYAFMVTPLEITFQHVPCLWFSGWFGNILCKLSHFFFYLAISSSILTLTAMTVDRYLAVVPLAKNQLARKRTVKTIVALWGICIVYALIRSLKKTTVHRYYHNGFLTLCTSVYSSATHTNVMLRKADYISTFVLLYVFPIVTMSIMHFFAVRYLWLEKSLGTDLCGM